MTGTAAKLLYSMRGKPSQPELDCTLKTYLQNYHTPTLNFHALEFSSIIHIQANQAQSILDLSFEDLDNLFRILKDCSKIKILELKNISFSSDQIVHLITFLNINSTFQDIRFDIPMNANAILRLMNIVSQNPNIRRLKPFSHALPTDTMLYLVCQHLNISTLTYLPEFDEI